MAEKNPEISIVMPMYNMEKYIGECLDSILAQTFTDYEVIIVDDCSTDKSCEIVESYKPKFGGKIQLIRSEKNSGYPGIPRNKGIDISKGRYICFLDSDDAFINTALEELYNAAEEFQVDVVHCERYFFVQDEDFTTDKTRLKADAWLKADFVDEPTLMPESVEERIKLFTNGKFDWSTFNNFIRRDFIKNNRLRFPDVKVCEDSIFAVYLLCLAETVVSVPNVIYVYRRRQGSMTETKSLDAKKKIRRFSDLFFRGLDLLDKFFCERNIFEENPTVKLSIFQFILEFQLPVISSAYHQAPLGEIDELIRAELEKLNDKTAITAFFFDYINTNYFYARKLGEKLAAVMKENTELVKETTSLKELGKSLIEQLQFSRVETQNLQSVFDNEKSAAFLKFNDGE